MTEQMIEQMKKETKSFEADLGAPLSRRSNQWLIFAAVVCHHIETYVVPQYGDLPDEQVAGMTAASIKAKMEYYWRRIRIGSGARGPEEAARDCLKIAHMAGYLYSVLTTGSAQQNIGGDK